METMSASLAANGAMARALERSRDRFNARFAHARRQGRGVDAEQFSHHLSSVVEPIVEAVAALESGRVDATVEALYDLSLDLLARGFLGQAARFPSVSALWQVLLPQLGHLIARDTRRLVAALTNAACNLDAEPGIDAARWIEQMAQLGPSCAQVEDYLEAGKVVAWRCGMAHYRESALLTWHSLDDTLKYAALGIEAANARPLDELAKMLEDPWIRLDSHASKSDRPIALVQRIGGFRGFGGPFARPPKLAAVGEQIYAIDGNTCWSLHADAFGATLQRAGAEATTLALKAILDADQYDVRIWEHLLTEHPGLRAAHSIAGSRHTLAMALTNSHTIVLLA